ncbi:MAG: epoxyqueuosine reductase QueH [Desulfomonilaceae bacterium]
MKILLHTCCAPCLVAPWTDLTSEGHEVTPFFYNPNIHPYSEYLRRLDALESFTKDMGIAVLKSDDAHDMEEWFRRVTFRERHRCAACFDLRIRKTIETARSKGYDAFSTTLFYSRFQKHDLLKDVCETLAAEMGTPLFYRDWRVKWNEGVKRYRATGLYRQKYCGCIYSEKERLAKIL